MFKKIIIEVFPWNIGNIIKTEEHTSNSFQKFKSKFLILEALAKINSRLDQFFST